MAVDLGVFNSFCYEAKVIERATDDLGPCYEAMHWLVTQGYHAEKDWIVDMHGGMENYTTFRFKDEQLRLIFQIRWA